MTHNIYTATRIRGLSVRDIRFPTSLESDGSDAIHPDPDYSCTYVILYTDTDFKGHGISFTIGRGNELVVEAVKSLSHLVVGKDLKDIYEDFAGTWRALTSESQLRWVGPEKGVIHLAVAAIVNALWDLWARTEHKPLWKLLVDMEPEKLVSTIDFRYIGDVLTKEEAVTMLKEMQHGREAREERMLTRGYPAYTTAAGWLGYSQEKIERLLKQFMAQGWRHFKIKVGQDIEDDKRRCKIVRDIIGQDMTLMVDANQKWDVDQAISWMKELAPYKPLWIEEPTSPDDVLGHAKIAEALKPLGIGVASGEMCQNRVIFKQMLQAGALNYCQIDACRVGGVNEVLAIYLMAKKFNVPVCPHAGGVGLCEMVQHLQIWDYISVSGTTKDRIIEYVDHLIEHFKTPRKINHCHYLAPKVPGYSVEMWEKSLLDYEFPYGAKWNALFDEGRYKDPRKGPPPWVEHRVKGDIIHR
ncbi:mitochondrial enolase superfamily member 1-like [Homarus americanus]|uniref:mitochondrial enolase superfamily member 1-like n=1 Tax=Homarus americanus TaxID=6706 RepID=UPI001C4412AB|nr:mitochondrial enolase superfamily member 1-like [Homarus americanus]XP_042233116.1 mitochondrial enolase superfamily member 1-like [Homarus americanus]XP_042233117.1 mitochondrial enolase superfamily member 1-like [Homarus americanus]XP_042233118.1 mitochondrial enolase superfamily member 1-like [Homarus americanus]XP_042233119.1 mitochondrial enolase superfamily member 1-like [Homarus americanus]XP_042233120.1 mitochondrial enolase superfamily member 1-like [Homarus americanus]XP_04223312